MFLIFHTHYPINPRVNTINYKAPHCTVSPTLLSRYVPTSDLTSAPCYPAPSKWVTFGALTAVLLSVAIFWATISHCSTHRPNSCSPFLVSAVSFAAVHILLPWGWRQVLCEMSISFYQTARRHTHKTETFSHSFKNLIPRTETGSVWEKVAEDNWRQK